MPEFAYKAINQNGANVRGVVDAASQAMAFDQLTTQGLFATSVIPAKEKSSGGRWARFIPFRKSVSENELALMIRRLATLVGADISLLESLDAMSSQVHSSVLRDILNIVKEDVRRGQSLSKALARHPHVFPELMVSMVRVGETGGILGTILEDLADTMEQDKEVRTEVRVALAYPALVLCLALATVAFLLIVVIPRLALVFAGMRTALPLPTVILLGAGKFMGSYGLLLLPLVLFGIIGIERWRRSPGGKIFFDRLLLWVPVVGDVTRKSSVARFARSLGTLVKGGVPLMEGLGVVKEVLDNVLLGQALDRIKERIRKGESMARALRDESIFPEMVRYMLSAGEESGHLDQMLLKVAHIYDVESRAAVKVMLSLLAPLLILVVAGIVGFIAVAMLLPIFQINQMIR